MTQNSVLEPPAGSPEPGRAGQEPSIQAWYDGNADRFAETAVIEEGFIGLDTAAQQRLNTFKLRAVTERVKLDGSHVLEFGCGHGRLAFAYPGMASYTGVDYSQNLVAIGNQRLAAAGLAQKFALQVGDVLGWQSPNKFDVVCSLGMMAYFPDPKEPLRRMIDSVRPGGMFFFDFRCDTIPYAAVRRIKWMLRSPTGGKSYMKAPAAMARLLRELGMVDVQVVSREFPLLGDLYGRRGMDWPLKLRDRIAHSAVLRQFSTEAWVFARKQG